jgi:hypothetical protein
MTVTFAQFKADIKADLFDRFDKDGNGTLTVKELKDAIKVSTKSEEGLQSNQSTLSIMFTNADLDADCDGAITFDEFWASLIKTFNGSGFPDESAFMEDFVKHVLTKEEWATERETLKADLDKASSKD